MNERRGMRFALHLRSGKSTGGNDLSSHPFKLRRPGWDSFLHHHQIIRSRMKREHSRSMHIQVKRKVPRKRQLHRQAQDPVATPVKQTTWVKESKETKTKQILPVDVGTYRVHSTAAGGDNSAASPVGWRPYRERTCCDLEEVSHGRASDPR